MKMVKDLSVIYDEVENLLNSNLSNVEKIKKMIYLQEDALRAAYMGNQDQKYEALHLYDKIKTKWNFIIVRELNEEEKSVVYRYIRDYEYVN